MKKKPYEVQHGKPGRERCKIVAHPDVDVFVYYWGYYDPKRDSWKLYSWKGTPAKYACNGMIVRAADVSYKPEKKPAPPKKEEPREKRWRYRGGPEGQIKLI